MKKISLLVWVACISFLSAGGDVSTYLSSAANIDKKVCYADKVYIEQDVQLMWQDAAYVDAEDGAYKRNRNARKAGSWKQAINYCSRLNYYGYSDWRLPTADELSHVHRKEGQVFTYFRGDDFWSSTPATERRYYVVYPVDSYQYKRYRSQSNYIRCVRCMGESEQARDPYIFVKSR